MRLCTAVLLNRRALGSLFVSSVAFSSRWGRQTLAMSSGASNTHRMERSDGYGGKGVSLIPSSGTATSTIIWLHGLGDTGEGWLGGLPHQRFPSTKFIFPTAPVRPISLNGGYPMPGWFDIATLDDTGKEDKPGFEETRTRIEQMIQGEVAAGVPADKIVLGGFSQGGAVTIYTALRSPVKLAGGVVLSGWMALKSEYPAALTESGKAIPFLHCHGDADQVVRYAWGKKSADAAKTLGLTYSFHTIPDLEHGATPEEIAMVVSFIQGALN